MNHNHNHHRLVSSEQQHLLSRALVPMRRRRVVRRRALQERLCHAIKAFIKDPNARWFLVHGMPGSGKTQLVNDVLWERPELCFAIVGRLLWLRDCRLASTGREWATFATESLLLSSMDQNGMVGAELEEFLAVEEKMGKDRREMLGQRLRRALADEMVDTLLVLDGLTSVESVRFFDEYKPANCKFLATSTSSEPFAMIDGLRTFPLGTDELDRAELAQLAKCHGIGDEFSEQNLDWILSQTGGNLALLEKLFTMAQGQQQIFNTLLANFANYRPLSEFSCHSAYSFMNLERPIQHCMEMLGDRLHQSLEYCTVLERFVWTPFEIISLIWPLDICGNEPGGQLDALALQQLQTVARHSLLDRRENAFRLQPLVHSFLLHHSPNSHPIFLSSCQSFLAKLRQMGDQGLGAAEYFAKNEPRLLDLAAMIQRMGQHPRDRAREEQSVSGQQLSWNNAFGFKQSFSRMLHSVWWPSTNDGN